MSELISGEGSAGPGGESSQETAREIIRQVKRYSRRRVCGEDKVRIVMEGLRGEEPVADLCRSEKITKGAYYRWLKSFLEGGKRPWEVL